MLTGPSALRLTDDPGGGTRAVRAIVCGETWAKTRVERKKRRPAKMDDNIGKSEE
jgi:hypothetical protein